MARCPGRGEGSLTGDKDLARASQVVQNPPASARDAREVGSTPGSGRSPGGGDDNPLQYSCLENSMARGTWRATLHRVAKSWTRLSVHVRTHTKNSLWRS